MENRKLYIVTKVLLQNCMIFFLYSFDLIKKINILKNNILFRDASIMFHVDAKWNNRLVKSCSTFFQTSIFLVVYRECE